MAFPAAHTIASYNILHDAYRQDWPAWAEINPQTGRTRWQQFLMNIGQVQPDILAVQECAPGIFEGLKQRLGKDGVYADHWEGNAEQGMQKKGEGVAILYNPARYQRLGVKSPVFRSEHQGRFLDRAHVWTDLLDRTTGKIIRVASVHLFGGAQREIGEQQVAEIRHQLSTERARNQNYEVDVNLLCGDFNGSHLPVEYNMNQPDFRVTSCFQEYMFDGSNIPTEPSTGRRIDYVFVKAGSSEIQGLEPIATHQMPQASDHHMTASRLVIGARRPVQLANEAREESQSFLSGLATRVYDLVWNQKYTIGFSLIGLVFGGLEIALGIAIVTALTQYAITWISPSCQAEVEVEQVNI